MKTKTKKGAISRVVFAIAVITVAAVCMLCFVGCGDKNGKKKPSGGDDYEHVKGEELTQSELADAIDDFLKCGNYTETSTVEMKSDNNAGNGRHDGYVATYKYDCENNVIEINAKGKWEGDDDMEQRIFFIYEDSVRYIVISDKSSGSEWTVRAVDGGELAPPDAALDEGNAARLLSNEIPTLRNKTDGDFEFDADKGVYAVSKQETEEITKLHTVAGNISIVKGSSDTSYSAELKFKDKRLVGVLYGENSDNTYEDGDRNKRERLQTSVITDVGATKITVPGEVMSAIEEYKAQNEQPDVKGEELTKSEFDAAVDDFLKYKNYTEKMTVQMVEQDDRPRSDEFVVDRKYDFDNNIVYLHTKGILEGEDTDYAVYYINENGKMYHATFDTAYHDAWQVSCYEKEMSPTAQYGEVDGSVRIYTRNIQSLLDENGGFTFDADKGVYELIAHEETETQRYKNENGEIKTIPGTADVEYVAQLRFENKRVAEVLYSEDSTAHFQDGSVLSKCKAYASTITDVGKTKIIVPKEVADAIEAYKKQNTPDEPIEHTCVFENYTFDVGSATCTSYGTDTSPCGFDGCNKTDTRPSELNTEYAAHVYTNYKYNNDATCIAGGTETAKCDNCENTDTRASASHLATGVHSFTEYVFNNDATCNSYGTDSRHCRTAGCDATESRATQINKEYGGHTFENYLCTACGKYSDDAPITTSDLRYNEIKDAEGNITGYSVYCTDQYISGGIWVPETYNNKPILHVGTFYGCEKLYSITIPNSVKSIGSGAFSNCSILADINIPNGVTSIDDSAFYHCYRLANIDIPDSVTSIGEKVFEQCYSLKNIDIPNSVTSIGMDAFRDCLSLKSVTFAENSNLTNIGSNAFSGCKSLIEIRYMDDMASWCKIDGLRNLLSNGRKLYIDGKEITGELVIPDGVTSIAGYAFYECSGLTSVTIPDSVTSIGLYAFSDCSSLEEIKYTGDIASWCAISGLSGLMDSGTSNKKLYIGGKEITGELVIPDGTAGIGDYAFYNCSSLTSVTIPNSVTSIGENAFSGCNNLIRTENGVQYADKWVVGCSTSASSVNLRADTVGIASYAFRWCSDLTSITIPDSVTSIGSNAFSGCRSLGEVRYTGDIASWCAISGLSDLMSDRASNVKLYIDGKEIVGALVIPDGVTSIGDYAFYKCSDLTSVTIPDSVTSIASYAFNGCNSIEEVRYTGDIASWCAISGLSDLMSDRVSNVKLYIDGKEIAGALVIPDGVTSIGSYAFYKCSGLTSVTIPDIVTSIGPGAFSGCSSIGEVRYAGDIASWCAINGLGSLMANGTSNRKLYIDGKEITGELVISDEVTSISGGAFCNCNGLTSITIPDSVTSIGDYAFSDCGGLTSITIPDSVTSIGDYAFSGCSGLTSITIPDSVTSIGSGAFSGSQIETATVPAVAIEAVANSVLKTVTITSGAIIDTHAFSGCGSLTSVTIPSSITNVGIYPFSGCRSLEEIKYMGDIASWCAISGLSDLMDSGTSNKKLYIGGKEIAGALVIPDGVTNIGSGAFRGCSSLTSVTIPGSVTSIGGSAFYNCRSLEEIKYMGDIASWCAISGLSDLMDSGTSNRKLYIGGKEIAGALVIPDGVTSIGSYAFNKCSGLTSVTISDSVTSIASYAFNGCSGLTSVTIPDSVTSIGENAFYGCNNLIRTENSVQYVDKWVVGCSTSASSVNLRADTVGIADSAFYGCYELTSISIPNSVMDIGKEAFFANGKVKSIVFGGTTSEWKAITKGKDWNYNVGNYYADNYTVICTDGTLTKEESMESL